MDIALMRDRSILTVPGRGWTSGAEVIGVATVVAAGPGPRRCAKPCGDSTASVKTDVDTTMARVERVEAMDSSV